MSDFKKLLECTLRPITNAFLGSETNSNPISGRAEFLLDKPLVTSHSGSRSTEIRQFVKKIKDNFEVEHVAVFLKEKLYCCTKAWDDIHSTDKQLIQIIRETRMINNLECLDIPIYMTHTSLT